MAITNDGSSNLDALVALLQNQQGQSAVPGAPSTGVSPVASPNVVPIGAPQVDAGSLGGLSPDSFKPTSSPGPQLVLNPALAGLGGLAPSVGVLPSASSSALWGGPSTPAPSDASAPPSQLPAGVDPGAIRLVVPPGVDPAALIQALNGASSPSASVGLPSAALVPGAPQGLDTASLMRALGATQPSSAGLSAALAAALAAQGKQG